MGIIEVIIGAIIELGVQSPIEAVWDAAQRREMVIRLLKRAGLDPDTPPKEFEHLYAYALAEWGIGKPKPLLSFFRYEYVKDAFRRAFHEGSPESLMLEAEEIIQWNKETGDLGPIHSVPSKEIVAFGTVFRTLALQSRAPSEVMRDQTIADVHARSQEILEKLDQLDTLEEVRQALKQTLESTVRVDSLAPIRRMVHPLLPAATFQKRPELFTLFDWWRNENKRGVVALTGIGGAGKTAIAHEFISSLNHGSYQSNQSDPIKLPTPDSVFVWSFYDAPYVEELFTVLLSHLNKQDFDPRERRANVFQVLAALEKFSEKRILLVLDGLERVQEGSHDSGILGSIQDHSLKQFVRRIAGGFSNIRLLVTTRLPLSDLINWQGNGYEVIEVSELPSSAAVALLRVNGVKGKAQQLNELAALYGYHALSLEALGNLLREFYGGELTGVDDIVTERYSGNVEVDVQTARLWRIFQDYERKLTSTEDRILQCLSVFRIPVNVRVFDDIYQAWIRDDKEAESQCLMDNSKVDLHLPRLSTLRLIHLVQTSTELGTLLTLHPAVRGYFRLRIQHPQSLHENAANKLAPLCMQEATVVDASKLDLFQEFLYHTAKSGRIEDAIRLFYDHAGYYYLGWRLASFGQGESITKMLLSLIGSEFPTLQTVNETQAKLVNQRGKFLATLGSLASSEKCFEYNVAAHKHLKNEWMLCRGLMNLCLIRLHRGNLTKALAEAEHAVLLAELPDIPDEERWDAFACRGMVHGLLGKTSAALKDFENAAVADAAKRSERDMLHGFKMVQYGTLLSRLGRTEMAEIILKKSLELYTKTNWPPDEKRCELALAHIAYSHGNTKRAKTLIDRAMKWGIETADQEILIWGHLIQARHAIDEGDFARALQISNYGLRLAEECGYGLLWIDLQNAKGAALLGLNLAKKAKACAIRTLQGVSRTNNNPDLYGALTTESGYMWGRGDALYLLGLSFLELADPVSAEKALQKSLIIRRSILDPQATLSEKQLRKL